MNAFQRMADTVMSFFDRSIERYTTMDYGQNSAYAEAAEKMSTYRDMFMQMFDEGISGYYRDGSPSEYNMFSVDEPFNKQVDEVLKPGSKYNKYVYVGQTQNLLQKCGFDPLPVLMTPGHIRDINTPKSKNKPGQTRFHGLTPDQIKHIPEMLKNPVMIYDSISPDNKDNTVCILTNEFDGDGNPIVVVFKYVGEVEKYNIPAHFTIETNDFNMVSTQYGKNRFYTHLLDLISNDKILYVNKSKFEKFINNKTLNFTERNKIQFLETFNKLGFDRIIHQSRNLVNGNNLQNYGNRPGIMNNQTMRSMPSADRNVEADNLNNESEDVAFVDENDNVIDDFDSSATDDESASYHGLY